MVPCAGSSMRGCTERPCSTPSVCTHTVPMPHLLLPQACACAHVCVPFACCIKSNTHPQELEAASTRLEATVDRHSANKKEKDEEIRRLQEQLEELRWVRRGTEVVEGRGGAQVSEGRGSGRWGNPQGLGFPKASQGQQYRVRRHPQG